MPLQVLVALVVLGIAGIAALTWALGFAARRRFATDQDARDAWAREFPEVPARAVTLCGAGTAALVTTRQGPGIVWAMGADSTARFLHGARITRSRSGLTVRLPDYTAPVIRLVLDDAEAKAWATTLGETA